ncbi:MAG: HEAT repeat domain-containing protein [Acidimicrobiia bacterium]
MAISALARLSVMSLKDWVSAAGDPDPRVRRRACELAPGLRDAEIGAGLLDLLGDPDPAVAETAAFAMGEMGELIRGGRGVEALAESAKRHRDPLVRESAVAALGSLGDPAGLEAILAACSDRPAIRRRAVLALAPFEGEGVEAAIARAREDRDWQVRDVAEDLAAEDLAAQDLAAEDLAADEVS